MAYRRVATLKTIDNFAAYLASLGINLGFDREILSGPDSPLGQNSRPMGSPSAIGFRFFQWKDGTEP